MRISDELQRAFLDAKKQADREGHTGTSYVDGIQAVTPIIQRDVLRQAWDAMVSAHAAGLDGKPLKIACAQVERIARELGVQL